MIPCRFLLSRNTFSATARCISCELFTNGMLIKSNQTGNAFDFYQYVLGKSGHLDGRPGGLVITECLFVDAVDDSKVVH